MEEIPDPEKGPLRNPKINESDPAKYEPEKGTCETGQQNQKWGRWEIEGGVLESEGDIEAAWKNEKSKILRPEWPPNPEITESY